jgi:hypothetical protein
MNQGLDSSTLRQIVVILLFLLCLQIPFIVAQDRNDKSEFAAPEGITFSDPVDSIWEFGLKINASGNSRGITAAIPIPMNWPEQEVEILSEEKTQNVGDFKKKNPTRHTRQFSFNVNRISGRQPEIGYIRFKIKKRFIIAPKDTSQFVIAANVPNEQKTFLKPSPYIESKHERICEIADELKDESLSAWDQVEQIYRWVRANVQYKFDTQIHSCLDALESGHGDCEELSSLFIAICRAQGIPARAVWIPDHTYPEFYLEDKQGKGHWFPCQAAGPYEFGAMSESKPILQKGDRFRIPGQRNEVRYIRPTLVARDAGGPLSIEWISRKVDVTEDSDSKKQPGR